MKQKQTNKLLSVLLTVCMIAGIMPWTTLPARANAEKHFESITYGAENNNKIVGTVTYSDNSTEDITFTKWTSTDSLPSAEGDYYLANDVVVNEWTIDNGKTIRLFLNGKTITINGYCSIYVNGNFELYDVSDNSGTISGHSSGYSDSWHVVYVGEHSTSTPTFTMNGGTITGGKADGTSGTDDSKGGGVYVKAGTFIMNGGKISGNTADHGAGVAVVNTESRQGKMTMNGGTISGNNATASSGEGGGVYFAGDTFTMNGGKISGNNAVGGGGGGVCVMYPGAFDMNRGEISGNTAEKGGGVCGYGGAFTMNGGTITLNTAAHNTTDSGKGGGVYVSDRGHTFTMNGGTITSNTADTGGGGMYVSSYYYKSGSYVEMGRPTNISGNPVISGNVTDGTITNGTLNGGTANNVYFTESSDYPDYSKNFTVIGNLGEDASIYVNNRTVNASVAQNKDDYNPDTDIAAANAAKFHTDGDDTLVGTVGADGKVTFKKAITVEAIPAQTYTGSAITPNVTVKNSNNETLTEDTNYAVAYSDNTNAGTATVTVTGAGDYGNAVKTFTINKAPLTVTALNHNIIYGEAPALTGVSYSIESFNASVLGGTLNLACSYSQYGNVGSYAITPSGLTSDNYDIAFATGTLTVEQKEATLGWSHTDDLTYNGSAQAPTATVTNLVNGDSCTVTVTGAQTNAGTGYTATASGLTGTKAGNYRLPVNKTTTFTIGKASHADEAVNGTAKFGASGTADLSALIVDGGTVGEITKADAENVLNGEPSVAAGKLNFAFVNDTEKVGKTATVTVPVTSANYADYSITVTLTVTDKDVPTLTVQNITKTYDGEAVTVADIQGSAKVGSTAVEGTWTFKAGQALTNVAHSGAKTVLFMPNDITNYSSAEATITLTINKAEVKGAPTYTAISASGKTLADAGLAVGTLDPSAGDLKWNDVPATAVTQGTAYGWSFTPTDPNYKVKTGSITLWPESSSGGGSGGGGSSSGGSSTGGGSAAPSNTTTTTTTNPDGSTTKTTKNADGSTTAVTTAQDGSTATVRTDKNGNVVSTEVNPSVKAIEEAAKSGEPVSLPVEVKATGDAGSAPEVKVTLPKGKTGVTVEIPVSNLTPGTVAVIVKPDGTEEIVRTSTTSKDGVVLTLDGSATVKLVDNSKYFSDVSAGDWFAPYVAWAASRGIMNGMGDGTFAPNATATRGQITQLLMNLDGAKAPAGLAEFLDVHADDWFAPSVAWAVESGVAQGTGESFGANDPVSREQLAVMLYRYAQYKGYDVSASGSIAGFPDASSVDGYAQQALAWAVGAGLINGTTDENGNVILDPHGNATRAQIAAIVERFCKNVAK